MAIKLNSVTSGYNISAMNDNFTALEEFVNNSAVWRTGTTSGETQMSRDLDMNGNKILNYPSDVTDSNSLVTVGEADSRYYNVDGDTLSGTMNVNGQTITNLPVPPTDTSPVRKKEFTELSNSLSTTNSALSAETSARIAADKKVYEMGQVYTDTQVVAKMSTNATTFVGMWLPTTISVFSATTLYSEFKSRGFYTVGDGGDGTWVSTGNTNTALAGTHVVAKGLVYDAAGHEYQIDISSGVVNVLENGAKPIDTADEATGTSTDFVCIGEVVVGIQAQLPVPVEAENTVSSDTGTSPLTINFRGGIYRVGRSPIIPYNGTIYNFNNSRFFVNPVTQDSSVSGRLDGIRFGYDEIKARYEAVGEQLYWGSLSLRYCEFNDGAFYGDHDLTKALSECYTGCGILILNGEYNKFNNMVAEQFVWPAVVKKAEVEATVFAADGDFDDNDVDYRYICDFMGSSRAGNFYGNNFNNCRFTSGRRGLLRVDSDWTYITGGTCAASWWKYLDSTVNTSGVIPSYFLVATGTGMQCDGMYLSANGSTNVDSNPSKGVVYTSAKGHVYSALYTEWTYTNFVVSKHFWGDATDRRSMGLRLDAVSTYKDNTTDFKLVKFESGGFGYYDDNGEWQWPTSFDGSVPTPQSIREFAIGAPVRDHGAFLHGGFDFKYGMYNVWGNAGSVDVDSIRGMPTSKEMFNPYGLLVSSGEVELPVRNPSMNSVIHVWIKDLSGNFDPKNLVLWQSASLENPKGNANDFLSYGESCIDYGNGYKLLTIANCRWNAFDGVSTWEASSSLRVIVDSSTPILLKAVEAYSGGISFFPQGCDYIPQSGLDSVMGNSAYYGQENGCGGGIFWPGDIVNPYLAVDRHVIDSPWLGSSYNDRAKVITSGGALETALSVDVTGSIITSGDMTVISVSDTTKLVAGQMVSIGGTQYRLRYRVMSSGLPVAQYGVEGNLGSVGASVTLSGSSVTSYAFKSGKDLAIEGALSVTGDISGSGDVRTGKTKSVYTTGVSLGYNDGYSGDKILSFYTAGDTTRTAAINNSSVGLQIVGDGYLDIQHDTTHVRSIQASEAGTYNWGTSSAYPANIYSQNSLIVVSDENYKTDISALTDAEIACSKALAKLYKTYKLDKAVAEKGDSARTHFGAVAQQVMQAFTDAGLDWKTYGIVTHETWDAKEAVTDIDGNVVSEAMDAGEIYMVRYDELNCLINAGQEARLEALESAASSTTSS